MSQRIRRGLATWLTSSCTPIFVLDDRRVILVFNSGCEELTQWSAAEVIGQTCLFQNDPNPGRVTCLTGALCPPEGILPGQMLSRPIMIQRKDGTTLERDLYFFLLDSSEEQGMQHVLGIMTERSQPPSPVADSHLQIGRHTAELYLRYGVDRLVATTPAMQRVAAQIEIARKHLATIHLYGEKGTGREHVARLIHYSSPQRAKRFIPIRCETASHFELTQILQRLAEGSEGDAGTVYLDEISLLPGDLQAVVLALCEQPGRRWISSSTVKLDAVAEEAFHPALIARLTALTITLPPLRDRLTDVPLLAQQLLEECNTPRSQQYNEFTPAVLRLFQQHAWPGNIDELAQVVAKACQRSSSSIVDVEALPMEFEAQLQSRAIRPLSYLVPLDEQLAQFERACIVEALKDSRGNKSLAAEKLGIPRAKLYRRLEQLGLSTEVADLDFSHTANLPESPEQ